MGLTLVCEMLELQSDMIAYGVTQGNSPIRGYTEKGKAIANALEDLKANFYCELCDKQYHKHQEFDNHINSYDHAHKQRLKELKQREFARNVASKSWKDEKKQEKALKRLHQLAELRKQPDCVSDGSPIFKTPRLRGPQEALFKNKDGSIAGSRCTVVCKGEPVSGSSISENKQDILFGRDILNNGRCCFVGNQTQLPFTNGSNVNNRAGVSFCFSKKALLKLDSSASVFNESTEEANECRQFLNHKAKQMSFSFRHYAHVDENARENSEDGSLTVQHETDKSTQGTMPKKMEISEEDDSNRNITKEKDEIAQSNIKVQTPPSGLSCTDPLSQTEEVNMVLRPEVSSKTSELINFQTKNCYMQENISNKNSVTNAILIERLSESLPQKPVEQELSCNSNVEHLDVFNESVQSPNKSLDTSFSESLTNNAQPNALSFLSVLSKDGSTHLQWPTELLLFTKTEPSISYGCNPLYFDFKCSRNNRFGKANVRIPKICQEKVPSKTTNEKKDSGFTSDRELFIERDSQSSKSKREKVLLEEMHEKDWELDNKRVTKEITQKANIKNLHENATQVSAHPCASQKCIVKESYHIRKRKISFHGWLGNSKESIHSSANENHLFFKEDSKNKKRKSLHNNHPNMMGKNERENCHNSNKNEMDYKNNIDISQSENDFSWDNSSDKSCSRIKESCSESDEHSVRYWRLPSSQMSPSGKVSMHSDSSNGNGSKYKHVGSFSQKSSNKYNPRRKNCIAGKHNSESSSEDEDDSISFIYDKKQKNRCRNLKHKACKKISKYQCPDRQLCSKHTRKEHQSRKKYKGHSHKSIQTNSSESFTSRNAKCNNSRAYAKERIYSNRSPHNRGSFNRTETKETSYKCYSQSIVPLSEKCKDSPSENTVKHIIVNEKKTLIAELLLERGHSTKQVEKEITSGKYSGGFGMKLKNQSQSYFAVNFPPSSHDTAILPLLKNVKASSKSKNIYDTTHTLDNGVSKCQSEESQGYEVNVTTNNDNCVFKDIIHIGTECRTLNTEIPVSAREQSRQLISEVQPFMQSSDPVHLNFSCALPSLRHSNGVDSPETKEEEIRLGLHDVNMKPGPVEGNVKFCYDSTMQDFSKTENNQKVYQRLTSPPLTQQPITFSPDEIDKYRLLQLQAQQHMQKQLLSKHFKAVPTTGSAVFSTAQAIQPVSIQQHPSITTFHHALMQHYAVTASMHSQPNHFTLPHLSPFPQSHFSPIALTSLTPTLIPTHPTFLSGHPLHLVSATAIHPTQLTIQAFPHPALIPTLLTPHPHTGMHSAIHLHPLMHPLFRGQDFHHHHHSGSNQTH
ncbi:hypothetical protein FKM82_007025 [Ascaphus truei]